MSDHLPIDSEPEDKPPKVIRLCDQIFFESFIEEVAEELQQKALLIKAGLGCASKADRFAFSLLEAKGYFSKRFDLYVQPGDEDD